MGIKKYYAIIRKLPPDRIYSWLVFCVKDRISKSYNRLHDNFFSTQIKTIDSRKLLPIPIDWNKLDVSEFDEDIVEELTRMYLGHRFDLLGSGWVKNGFYNNAAGFEGYRYDSLVISDFQKGWLKQIISDKDEKRAGLFNQFISKEYIPIDWQKDYKTGYRWDARQWYRPVELARLPGADIKVPWELSRLEHLPRLAIFAYKDPQMREQLKQEFMDVCMDFMRQNPVRRGVNWMCTMDVGIRTANIALAYSLFKAIDPNIFQDRFEYVLTELMEIHCKHIYHNLEWWVHLTSNHYFANICGLLYGAAVLPKNPQAKRWLRFARNEYQTELLKQFYKEGSNFEGSVGYHRLSGEMAVYTGALIECLARRGICKGLNGMETDRIIKIGKFAEDTMHPGRCFVQIGDNDSGRFFTLTPIGSLESAESAVHKYRSLDGYCHEKEERYWDEQVNSPEQLISAVKHLIGFEKYNHMLKEAEMINERSDKAKKYKDTHNEAQPYQSQWFVECDGDYDLVKGLRIMEYPCFGIYIFRSDHLYLCVNGADNGQLGNGGHAHNDKLSFELWINGKAIYQDAGTYVYTALVEERNTYRSSSAHNCIQSGQEQNRFLSTFSMSDDTRCELLELNGQRIVLQVSYGEIMQRRSIQIDSHRVIVTDESNRPILEIKKNTAMTGGYGKLLRGYL